jgi:hypothetical protein
MGDWKWMVMSSAEESHDFQGWTLSGVGLAEVTTACRIRAKHSDLATVREDAATRTVQRRVSLPRGTCLPAADRLPSLRG